MDLPNIFSKVFYLSRMDLPKTFSKVFDLSWTSHEQTCQLLAGLALWKHAGGRFWLAKLLPASFQNSLQVQRRSIEENGLSSKAVLVAQGGVQYPRLPP